MEGYQKVAATYADYQKEQKNMMAVGKPYEFKNMMPFEVYVFYSRPWVASELNLIGKIPPNGYELDFFQDTENNILQGGGSITAFYADKNEGLLKQLAPAIVLTDHLKRIRVGAIGYNSYADTDYHNSYSDIPSLRVKNHFPFPIDIWYQRGISNAAPGNVAYGIPGTKGNTIVAKISENQKGKDGFDIIMRNYGNGFMIGDVVGVGLRGASKPFLQITLTDPLVRNLYMGIIDVN